MPRYPTPGTSYSFPDYSVLNPANNWPGSAVGKPNPASDLRPHSTDQVVWNTATARYENSRTKQPWTGQLPNGQYAANGRISQAPTAPAIDPNNPNQRYKAVDIVKDPAIASASDDLLAQFKKTADASLGHFNDYLKEFQNASKTAFDKSKIAADTSGTEAALRGELSQYRDTLSGAASDYANLNTADAARQRDIVRQANDLLPMYDQAATNIGDRQAAELRKLVSRYKLGTGTPTSLGSDEQRILARGLADVMLPLEEQKIGRRYDVLSNLALPVERDITGRETSRIASFVPSVAGSIFGAGTGVANQIQALKERVANMSMTDAVRYLQMAGVPAEVMQHILGVDISQLGAISQLRDQSRYRGLQDLLGVNLSQPQSFNFAGPPVNTATDYGPSRYSFSSASSEPALHAPNAPTTVNPNRISGRYNPALGDLNYNPGTGSFVGGGGVPITGSNVTLPNNFRYGRTPAEQAAFEAAQAQWQ